MLPYDHIIATCLFKRSIQIIAERNTGRIAQKQIPKSLTSHLKLVKMMSFVQTNSQESGHCIQKCSSLYNSHHLHHQFNNCHRMREEREEFMRSHGTIVNAGSGYRTKTYAQIASRRTYFDQSMMACLAAIVLLCLYLVYTVDLAPSSAKSGLAGKPFDTTIIQTLVLPQQKSRQSDDRAQTELASSIDQSNQSSFRQQYELQLEIYNKMMEEIKSTDTAEGDLGFQLPGAVFPS